MTRDPIVEEVRRAREKIFEACGGDLDKLLDRLNKEGKTVIKTLHGRVHGKNIEFTESIGVPDGQEVEVLITVLPGASPMSEGLRKAYAILGERFDSGEHDVAARHNEHQP